MSINRILDIAFALAFIVAFFGLILSPLWLFFAPAAGPVFLGVAAFLDLALMTRIIRGHFRPPGHFVPALQYIVFTVFGLRWRDYFGLGRAWAPLLAALLAFHLCCQYLAPAAQRWLTVRRR